ncbi:MAG: LytTR family transcriptional regulator [Tannerella sp.]|jgi:hypothetical protein|nr:LytTR family transcriptional regulator [Tannerella sp.]
MKPFPENKKGYLAANFLFALPYAFLTGGLPAAGRLADGAVYGLLLVFAGIALWNLFSHALPDVSGFPYRPVFIAMLAVLTTGCLAGVETLAVYLCFPSCRHETLAAVPVRLFLTFLWFALVRLYHLSSAVRQEAATPPVPSLSPAQAQASPVERITVRHGQKIKIIPLEDILYLSADGDYVSIHTAEGHWLKEQTMKYTEEVLPAHRFVRIHRSYMVNLAQISRIERYGEKQSVVLHNGEKIRVSSARYQLLRQRLDI